MHYVGRIGAISETRLCSEEMLFEWQIPNFSLLLPVYDRHYDSPSFEFSNAFWRFDMCPFKMIADMNSVRDSAILALTRNPGCPPMTIQYAIAIKGAKKEKMRIEKKHEFSDNSSSITFNFPWHELNNLKHLLRPKGMLIFSCQLRRVEPNSAGGVEKLQKCLHKLLSEGEDTDVCIKVQGKEFPVHRAILRARSPVFQAMFTHNMVERQSGVVTMEDCDPESFPAFLEHIYTGSTEIISVENVFSLFTAADKYDLSILKEECTKFIKNNMTVSCLCDAITIAVKHNETELIQCATEFFSSNVSEVLKTVEWQIFLKENMTVGNELLIKAFGRMEKELIENQLKASCFCDVIFLLISNLRRNLRSNLRRNLRSNLRRN